MSFWQALCPTYVFPVAAVSADAAKAAVDHLDGAEHQLQEPHGQQDGEEDHVPHHGVLGGIADGPHCLVGEVTAAPAGPTSKSRVRTSLERSLMVIQDSGLCC